MRIDQISIQNYKKFQLQTFELAPHFNLLVGENGSGKTSVLDALAVARGIWLVEPPDTMLVASGRNILPKEIRLDPSRIGDRIQFREQPPVVIAATGKIGDRDPITWRRQIRKTGKRTTNAEAKDALMTILDIYQRDRAGENVLCPVIAYYGAGRAWLPSNQRIGPGKSNGPARRWAAFYDCLTERIRVADIQTWFINEQTAAGHIGQKRPGFEIVKKAILLCIPDADDVWFDPDQNQIVLSINGWPQPFGNMSAGQQMMLALVADLSIKAVTQNAYLVTDESVKPNDETLPPVLARTPGVVLVDEIDVHLHPRWRRRVINDLMRTFPSIQFIATTHSPQVIGELPKQNVLILHSDGTSSHPMVGTRGAESNEILRYVMSSTAQDPGADALEKKIDKAIDDEDVEEAEKLYNQFLGVTEEPTVQLSRVRALVDRERALKDAL